MKPNPYEPPTSASEPEASNGNVCGRIGFYFSATGVIALFAVPIFVPIPILGPFVVSLVFLSLPGMLLSFVGLFPRSNSRARWGFGLGIFGSMYLPTLYLTLHPYLFGP